MFARAWRLGLAGTLLLSSLTETARANTAEPPLTYVVAGTLVDVIKGEVLTGQCIWISGARFSGYAPCLATPPEGATVIDWSAFSVLPGLIDLHTHLADTGQNADIALPLKTSPAATALVGAFNAKLTLDAGFTTVRDVGTYRGLTDVALRDAINAGQIPGPRMFVAGAYITIPKGGGELNGVIANEKLPADMRLGVIRNPAEAKRRAEFLFAHHVDFLKLIATGAVLAIGTEPGQPELSEAEMRAAVHVATANGSYATAHAHGAEGIKAAIRAGVRSIEHASLIDDEGLAMAKAAGVWLVMDIYNGDYIETVGTREGWPVEYLRKNRETTDVQRAGFAKAVKMGIRLAYGTDAGVYPHGDNAKQLRYMVQYGMTPMQAIQSATIRAAELMNKDSEVGSISPGVLADVIAIEGDPLLAGAAESVAHVMKAGTIVK
ncbi:MAG: amidohydrolase family protein [Sphingomonadaceae bacterium]